MSSELEQLRRELTHANELLTSMRQKRSSSLIEGEVLSLSPAAAKASAMLKSGLTLTQIYSNYVEVSGFFFFIFSVYMSPSLQLIEVFTLSTLTNIGLILRVL